MKLKSRKIYHYIGISAVVVLLGIVLFQQLWFTADKSPQVQGINGISTFTTDSGLKVMYLYAPQLPMLDLELVVNAGSIQDGEKEGLAYLTNSLLDRGTEQHSADRFADSLASVGAIMGQGVTKDNASISLRSLTEEPQLETALKLFFEVLEAPALDEKSFALRQSQQLAQIKYHQQSPAKRAKAAFRKQLYPDHPYGSSTLGNAKTVKPLTPADVKQFFASHYGVDGAVLAIVGDVTERTAQKIASKVGEILAARETISTTLSAPEPVAGASKTIDFPSKQTHIIYGALGVKRGDPDYFPLYVGNHILGGGMVSKLYQDIREESGLAYSVYSYFIPRRELGPFVIGMQTRNEASKQALLQTQQVLADYVANGPTEEELEAAKKYITGNFPLRVSSNSDMVGYLAMIGFYDLPLNYLLEFNNNINRVTAAEIKDALTRRIHPEQMITVMVGQTHDN